MGDHALSLMHMLRIEDGRRWGEVACDQQVQDAEAILGEDGPRSHFVTRPRGGSKPLALDTPLPTPTGWTTMGDVRRGDYLLSEHGAPVQVTQVGDIRYGEDCYRVSMAAGEPIVASSDHEWLVEDRQIKANRGRDYTVTATTVELRERLRYGSRGDLRWGLPVAQPFDLEEAKLPIAPYVLGAWLGDGHSETAKITVADEDRAELSAMFEIAGAPFGTSTRKPGAHCATWRFGNPFGERVHGRGPVGYDSTRFLGLLGLINNKHIPPEYLRSSQKQRMGLLRGLMDADGHQSHSMSIFNTTSLRLAEDVAEIVVSLGWKAFRQGYRATLYGKDCGPAYRVEFRADETPFCLARKTARWLPPGAQGHRGKNRTILSVEPVPSVPVRCIAVDSPTHLYLAGRSAVPTHNTTDLAAVTLSWLVEEAPPLSRGFVVAASAQQAAILMDAAAGLVANTPELSGAITVENERLIAENGAWVRVLTADGSSAWGLRGARMLICDEFAQWPETRGTRRVWIAVLSTKQKTPGCRLIILTSAGEPGHFSYEVLSEAKRQDEMWRVSEMPGPVPWVDLKEIKSQHPMMTDSEYARLHLNQWTTSEEHLVSEEDLEAACREDADVLKPKPGRYIVTVDLGGKVDATVVCVAHLERLSPEDSRSPRRVVVDMIRRWKGSRTHPVSFDEIAQFVAFTSRYYNRAQVHFDPTQAIDMVQRLNAQGVRAHELPFTASSVGQFGSALVLALRNRQLSLPNDPDLKSELLRVRLKETTPGSIRLDHARGGHDDQAVVIAMAVHLLMGKDFGVGASFREFMAREIAKRPEDSQKTRVDRELNGRRAHLHRERERTRRRCEHRWNPQRTSCVFCGTTQED